MVRTFSLATLVLAVIFCIGNAQARTAAPLPEGFVVEGVASGKDAVVRGLYVHASSSPPSARRHSVSGDIERPKCAGEAFEKTLQEEYWLYATATQRVLFSRLTGVERDKNGCISKMDEKRFVTRKDVGESVGAAWPRPFLGSPCSRVGANCWTKRLLGVRVYCHRDREVGVASEACISIEKSTFGLTMSAKVADDSPFVSEFYVDELIGGGAIDSRVLSNAASWCKESASSCTLE